MKKIANNVMFIFIGILISGITVYASTILNSSDILFDNSGNGMTSTNVQDALEELYGKTYVCTKVKPTMITYVNSVNTTSTVDITKVTDDYKNLTVDNFQIKYTSDASTIASTRSDLNKDTSRGYAYFYKPTLSYDATTGVLTISSGYMQAKAATGTGYMTQGTANVALPFQVYILPGATATLLESLNGTNVTKVYDIAASYSDYKYLTEDNFYLKPTANTSIFAGVQSSLDKDSSRGYANFYKPTITYDATTGRLTVTTGYLYAKAATDTGFMVQNTATTPIAYNLYIVK